MSTIVTSNFKCDFFLVWQVVKCSTSSVHWNLFLWVWSKFAVPFIIILNAYIRTSHDGSYQAIESSFKWRLFVCVIKPHTLCWQESPTLTKHKSAYCTPSVILYIHILWNTLSGILFLSIHTPTQANTSVWSFRSNGYHQISSCP